MNFFIIQNNFKFLIYIISSSNLDSFFFVIFYSGLYTESKNYNEMKYFILKYFLVIYITYYVSSIRLQKTLKAFLKTHKISFLFHS